MRWLVVAAAVAILLLVPNCNCGGGSGVRPDAEFLCSPECKDGEACYYGECVATPAPCAADTDCLGDTYCDETHMVCLPWGVGPGGDKNTECKRDPVPGVFFPNAQCEWTGDATAF